MRDSCSIQDQGIPSCNANGMILLFQQCVIYMRLILFGTWFTNSAECSNSELEFKTSYNHDLDPIVGRNKIRDSMHGPVGIHILCGSQTA
jgi:hypothetical protein